MMVVKFWKETHRDSCGLPVGRGSWQIRHLFLSMDRKHWV